MVFIPSRDPDPETAYTLIVSADAKDSGDLKLGVDYHVTFIPDIPWLQIISLGVDSLSLQNGGGSLNFVNNSTIQVPMDASNPEVLGFTLRFSQPFISAGAKQDAAFKIALTPFFPGTLAPIALRSVNWPFDDRIHMEWEGLKAGTLDERHFYKLVIPGGRGGIHNGGGMYFKEDQILYLEAVR
jgi:hypothetical protein